MTETNKLIRIAVDAPPGSLKSPRNYGALQLASLGALPPRAPLSAPLPNVSIGGGCDIYVKDEGHTYTLSPKANNSCKLHDISGTDYLNGLNHLTSHDVIVRNLITNKATFGLTENGSAIISFQEKVSAFEGLLSSPAWIPFRANKWPGARQICEIAPNRWEAFCPDNSIPSILIEVVRNPEENIILYDKGIINQTADTATPFNSMPSANGQRIVKKTSLRGILVFSGELVGNDKKTLRKEIKHILKQNNCGEHVGWANASTPFDDPMPLENLITLDWSPTASKNGLILAFSDYYPNATVAWSIATTLHKNGILCTPVSDSYSNPKVKAAMRLMIVSGPTDDAWGRYASLILCPAWRSESQAQKLYFNTLKSPEFSNAHRQLLDDLLDDLCPAVIIGAIPSICLSNINLKI
ncbi:hypothetical protein K7402_05330 [Pseudomonas fluorescens group sp.]|uniref:Uncharacterized protein n=2 Tax=Pseudomonas fluorescens TaxID=294 RepID=C3KB15_PSEFS|nr:MULTISPECIES: hypothetical protein [Pseudomonas fluorescens group]MBZ6453963.1 hypothetical protein [Pseudomonas fluorescens group sp.]MBZ6459949.1 hypothetical protein [Pseudomonas fluorescens group sp.]MBZ6466840.1 hypothetical protein [Pseudomonas fluorescens group sp.]WQD75125.1 hypothetical protein U0037_14620 [Pseudomonas marginalis]CAI2797149.1 Uncharacterized protein PFLU_2927 [Pseudomonas fluorescens SBW25]